MKNLLISFILIVATNLFTASLFVGKTQANHSESIKPQPEILGTRSELSPTPLATPKPTKVLPTPFVSPTPSPSSTPSPTTTTQIIILSPTPTPVATPQPSPTPSPTPSPSTLQITIDYSGASDRPQDEYSQNFTNGVNAWQVIKNAVGEQNLTYTDYGTDLGIFIISFNGVAASGNQFWEFFVNDQSATTGVSNYIVNEGDHLKFQITTW